VADFFTVVKTLNCYSLDLNAARDDGVLGWQWHQLDHMQTICTSLQTNNHTNTSHRSIFTGWMLFLAPNQHCQSTEGNVKTLKTTKICSVYCNFLCILLMPIEPHFLSPWPGFILS